MNPEQKQTKKTQPNPWQNVDYNNPFNWIIIGMLLLVFLITVIKFIF